jgi:hypothetical protein
MRCSTSCMSDVAYVLPDPQTKFVRGRNDMILSCGLLMFSVTCVGVGQSEFLPPFSPLFCLWFCIGVELVSDIKGGT